MLTKILKHHHESFFSKKKNQKKEDDNEKQKIFLIFFFVDFLSCSIFQFIDFVVVFEIFVDFLMLEER